MEANASASLSATDLRPASPRWLALAALALVSSLALAMGRVTTIGFVWLDDALYVTRNAQVLAGLTWDGVAWAVGLGVERSTYFHPLTWLSLMADVTVFGRGPTAMHLENLALHAGVAWLLFTTALAATGRRWPSLGAALLFALHPLTVEPVAWITERKTVLATFLGLAAVRVWVAHLGRPARWRLGAVVALFAMSLLARPQLVVLPVLLLVLDLWPLRRLGAAAVAPGAAARFPTAPWPRLVQEKWPLAAVSLAGAALVVVRLPPVGRAGEVPPPLGFRLVQAVASVADYAGAVVWPTSLAILREYPEEVSAGQALLGAGVLIGLTAAALAAARRRPWFLAGWLWFLVALSPALGLVQSGLWPAWADRFAYAPLLGVALAVAFGLAEVVERRPRAGPAVVVAAAAGLLSLGLATRAEVARWQSSATLFGRAVELQPRSALLRTFHASTLLNEDRIQEALAELEEATRLAPGLGQAHGVRGDAYRQSGQPREAAAAYQAALALAPGDADIQFAMGRLAHEHGWTELARLHLIRFLALSPLERPQEVADARAWLLELSRPRRR
jgi:tetratricopeptide (TPR) repeat protein